MDNNQELTKMGHAPGSDLDKLAKAAGPILITTYKPPLCINCKWHSVVIWFGKPTDLCNHTNLRSVVNGLVVSEHCKFERNQYPSEPLSRQGRCGYDGDWFQPKEINEQTPQAIPSTDVPELRPLDHFGQD